MKKKNLEKVVPPCSCEFGYLQQLQKLNCLKKDCWSQCAKLLWPLFKTANWSYWTRVDCIPANFFGTKCVRFSSHHSDNGPVTSEDFWRFSEDFQTLPNLPEDVPTTFEHSRSFSSTEFVSSPLLNFLKQGPAYKREGPDPNKGSNQQ